MLEIEHEAGVLRILLNNLPLRLLSTCKGQCHAHHSHSEGPNIPAQKGLEPNTIQVHVDADRTNQQFLPAG